MMERFDTKIKTVTGDEIEVRWTNAKAPIACRSVAIVAGWDIVYIPHANIRNLIDALEMADAEFFPKPEAVE